jgi:hypothetical protein
LRVKKPIDRLIPEVDCVLMMYENRGLKEFWDINVHRYKPEPPVPTRLQSSHFQTFWSKIFLNNYHDRNSVVITKLNNE